MTERRKLSNTIRFEVFKRDRFTCQYCGGKAPDVVLNVDHIKPVADGGTDDLMNLATSCWTCNSGKSDRAIADDSAVVLARNQADMIEERRNQVRMMADWQVELSRMDVETEAINDAFDRIAGRTLTDQGKREMRNLVRKFGVQEVIAAVAIAYDQYPAETAYSKISGICRVRKMEREDPEAAEAHRAINRIGCFLPWSNARYIARDLLVELVRQGVPADHVYRHVSKHRAAFRNWRDVRDLIENMIADVGPSSEKAGD